MRYRRTHLYDAPRILSSLWFICTNIQVKLPMAYRFMLMTLSIIQHSLPLNHACKSKNMPVAPYTGINLCVCPGGSWICLEGSLLEVWLNLYPLWFSYLFCMLLASWRWPCPEDWEPQSCPLRNTSPCRSFSAASLWWLKSRERMSDFLFECLSESVCLFVSKSWPGFRRAESHRLGSPLDGQGLA